jgi:hypothetical protein
VRLGTRVTFRGGLVWAMGLFLVAAVVGSLALHGESRSLVVDGLGIVAVWMSAGVCWLAVCESGSGTPRSRFQRLSVIRMPTAAGPYVELKRRAFGCERGFLGVERHVDISSSMGRRG